MLYENSNAFLAEPNKRVTLMGMSNVGKTRLASLLPRSKPRYEAITSHGYVVSAREVAGVAGEEDFLRLVGDRSQADLWRVADRSERR
jgi:adenylate kinase